MLPKKKKKKILGIQDILSNSQYTFLGPTKLDFLCNSLKIKFIFQTRNKLAHLSFQSPFQAKLIKNTSLLFTLIVLNTKFDPNQIFTAKSSHEFRIYFPIKSWVNHTPKRIFFVFPFLQEI